VLKTQNQNLKPRQKAFKKLGETMSKPIPNTRKACQSLALIVLSGMGI
jgi:hypothetical protein